MGRIDLHTHTTASDGRYPPAALVDLAVARGVEVLAVTDHDSTEGVAAAQARGRERGLEVWPGVEISTDLPQAEVHILGYFVDTTDPTFQATLRRLRESRRERAWRMVQRLADLGRPVSWERVVELAGGGAIGRPHIAQAMVERGYVASIREAFERYLGRGGPAYVERYKLTPVEAVRLIRQARGLPALAHPLFIGGAVAGGQPAVEALLPDLVAAGLVGLEVYYPGYDETAQAYLLALAARYDLVPTGGSDFHGRDDGHGDLGSVDVPLESVARLRALAVQRPPPG